MASKTFYAVVAGVGAGTGRSVALRFAKAYPVALLARRPESYNDIVEEIKKAGGQAIGVSADTSDEASVKAAFESIKKEFAGKKLAAAVCMCLNPFSVYGLIDLDKVADLATVNVGAGFAVKPFLELKAEDLANSLNGNA
jgi:NAD(P)-dependent dehydrogenase (short-subunit alcohol dehydrogenase family)